MKPSRNLSSSPSSPRKRLRLAHAQFNPIKIASPEAASAVDADPPLPKLLKAVKDGVKNPPKTSAVVYWMRMSDLRLNDNGALSLAAQQAAHEEVPLLTIFVISPEDYIAHDQGSRRIDFTLRNLKILQATLLNLNIPLYVFSHAPRKTLPSRVISLLTDLGCTSLFGNIEYELDELRRDIAVCQLAEAGSIQATFVHNKCIIEPGLLLTGQHKTYAVFSPFYRKWITELNEHIDEHLKDYTFSYSNPTSVRSSEKLSFLFDSDVPDALPGFESSPAQDQLMIDVWPAGEDAANANRCFSRFLSTKARRSQLGAADPLAHGEEKNQSSSRIAKYAEDRDRVDSDTTSRLSPYLSAGVLSPRACVRETMSLQQSRKVDGKKDSGVGRWLQEMAWRDFYTHTLAAHPRVSMGRPYLEKFSSVVWENHQATIDTDESDTSCSEMDSENLRRWKEGKTGVPIVDAAMRCLGEMGWVHNRMRMISAMYLTKDLMIDWRVGERYFMEQLIDGDLASNNGGWQWCASTGVDSCPYFRIFNPYSQSSKVDPTGAFIKHWVPELRELSGPELYKPSPAVADRLGYPRPLIEHEQARERALRRYKSPGKV
ncbi:FAD binding domain of DNA photolyase-domain-containing protein [Amanita rubescens]|nr:FAD binding domain of DNA photolyase-domain-containing protein [Amanita rubescens]